MLVIPKIAPSIALCLRELVRAMARKAGTSASALKPCMPFSTTKFGKLSVNNTADNSVNSRGENEALLSEFLFIIS